MNALMLVVLIAVVIALASTVTMRSWKRFARKARGAPGFALPREGPPTPLDQAFDGIEKHATGQHGVTGLFDNTEAFAARAHSARLAGRSIDVMTYIWHTDLTGWLLLRDVLDAADRGARVRLLLDDIYVQGFDPVFLALSQHENIEVRLFNPVRNRGHVIRRGLETMLGMSRYNRRLHSKAWIVDGRLAIIGGRNIGDTYFGRSGSGSSGLPITSGHPRISRDADVLLCGPAVAEIESAFDGYWNLSIVLPIKALLPGLRISLKWFRRQAARKSTTQDALNFAFAALDGLDPAEALTTRMHWTDKVRVLADPPEKAFGVRKSPWMDQQVRDVLAATQTDLRLITPYFVPGNEGLADLESLCRRGVTVSLLTNALSASDNIFVHGAYRHYRWPLLVAGARLFEFAPPEDKGRHRDVLHAKVFIMDHEKVLIGSPNFDMRSAYTNAELAVLIEHPQVVAEALEAFARDSDPAHAYALTHEGRSIIWHVTREDLPPKMWVEPESPLIWRAISWTVGYLPIKSWL